MADSILKRLSTRRIIECKDEAAARAVVRQIVLDNIALEERVDADARQLLLEHAKAIKESGARLPPASRQGQGEARAGAGIRPLMRMSRERIFHLADLIVKELGATPRGPGKGSRRRAARGRAHPHRESKLDDSIDVEVRKTLTPTPGPPGGQSRVGNYVREDARGGAPPPLPDVRAAGRRHHGRDRRHLWHPAAPGAPRRRRLETHLVISAPGKRTIVEETDYAWRRWKPSPITATTTGTSAPPSPPAPFAPRGWSSRRAA